MQRPYPFSSYLSPNSSLPSPPTSPSHSHYPLYHQEHAHGRVRSNTDFPVSPGYRTLHRAVTVQDLNARSPIQSLINKFEQGRPPSTTFQLPRRQKLPQYSDTSSIQSRQAYLSSVQTLRNPLP